MLNESESVDVLLECLRRQTFGDFTLYVCVNQPESWRNSADEWHIRAVEDNRATIEHLSQVSDIDLRVIDRCGKGRGWPEKRKGVGWARKELMETIVAERAADEVVVSMDADTRFDDDYLECVNNKLAEKPDSCAVCVPYRHQLTGDPATDRRLLRYECYMRHYMIGMLEIGSPYAFTALGSAMAFPLWAYLKVGGITPLQGGEDFYLMQKLAKCGIVELTGGMVYPQGRVSHRVPFGTGPAVALTIEEQSVKYPFYSKHGFGQVAETYRLFPVLFEGDVETPMSAFLRRQLKVDDLWGAIRRNFKSRDLFVRACHERVDGLRILQFLRSLGTAESCEIDFSDESLPVIEDFRDSLFRKEMALRQIHNAGIKRNAAQP